MDDPYIWASIELTWTMGLLAMILMLQLGNLLLDSTDLHVVGPLPVSERTLYAAADLPRLALHLTGPRPACIAGRR